MAFRFVHVILSCGVGVVLVVYALPLVAQRALWWPFAQLGVLTAGLSSERPGLVVAAAQEGVDPCCCKFMLGLHRRRVRWCT